MIVAVAVIFALGEAALLLVVHEYVDAPVGNDDSRWEIALKRLPRWAKTGVYALAPAFWLALGICTLLRALRSYYHWLVGEAY